MLYAPPPGRMRVRDSTILGCQCGVAELSLYLSYERGISSVAKGDESH